MIYIRRLYEVIYNTYNIYNNNYHNSININNILINIFNNKSNINKELNNQYENIIRIRKNKEKDDFQKAAKDKTNLDNILSFEICKKIFSCLTEKKKLEIIQYNNNMQNELDININNYKCFTGKYLKNENIVREYNHDDKLIYEGEYLNGKRNGKGKEYYENGLVKFEGEYMKGKKWNGKGYDKNNNIIYTLNNGKGFIKEYNNINFLIFEGKYLNGEKNGKGKEYDYYNGKLIFDGEYLNGKKWSGKIYNNNNYIDYELKEGKKDLNQVNFGKEYINIKRNRKEYNNDGILIFEGEYLNGQKNGKGKEYNEECELKFEGEYLYNFKIKGKEYMKGRLEYEGEYFHERKYNGKGYDKNGILVFELKNGNGKIKEYNSSSLLIFDGEYLNGKKFKGILSEYSDNGYLKSIFLFLYI